MNSFKDFKIEKRSRGFVGDKIKISRIIDREITVHAFKIEDSKIYTHNNSKCLSLQISVGNEMHVVFTSATQLIDAILQIPKEGFPFKTTIVRDGEMFLFT